MIPNMIDIVSLNKSFKGTSIFSDFTLRVAKNETVIVEGASGCGKTTLLRMIAGLDNNYSGTISLDDKVMTKRIKPWMRDCALVMQEPVLWGHMTIRENILYPIKDKETVQDKLLYICEQLKIGELLKRYPDEISGGQAKRASLARALISDKNILLFDEPLSNIDDDTKYGVIEFLKKEYINKRTIMYVSHDKEEGASLGGRILSFGEAAL